MDQDRKVKNWNKVDYINLEAPDIKEDKCLLAEAAKEEMKKPAHLRNFHFYISCRCKRCRILAY